MRDDLHLEPLTDSGALRMLAWREPRACRTTGQISLKRQYDWFTALDPSESLWYEVDKSYQHVASVALQHIDRVNARAEVSLVVAPFARGGGVGEWAVDAILRKAFGELGLASVWGECYESSGAAGFWRRMVDAWAPDAYGTVLPLTRAWQGRLYGSYLFVFSCPGLSMADGAPRAVPASSDGGVV